MSKRSLYRLTKLKSVHIRNPFVFISILNQICAEVYHGPAAASPRRTPSKPIERSAAFIQHPLYKSHFTAVPPGVLNIIAALV
jgi:hypothetical protein